MTVYLAAKFESKDRMRLIKKSLEELGYPVISRWLDEEATCYPETITSSYRANSVRDLEDIKKAKCLILDTTVEDINGGREVEWGFAMSRMECLRLLVGPHRNVFHTLAHHSFADWNECLKWLARGN